jgi:hypothetical protein
MEAMRRILPPAILHLFMAATLGLSTLGCAGANLVNREEYSVAVRKPAHRYRSYSSADTKSLAVLREAFEIGSAGTSGELATLAGGEAQEPGVSPWPPSPDSEAFWELNHGELGLSGPFEPFRPFSYCYLHRTSHEVESAVAVPAAPVDYALGLTATLTGSLVKAMGSFLVTVWTALFPQTDRSLPGKPPAPPLKDPGP